MAGTDRKDTLGYLGNEDLTGKEVLRCLAASLEQLAKSESVEAAELARREAHALIARPEPLVAVSADVRSRPEEVVRSSHCSPSGWPQRRVSWSPRCGADEPCFRSCSPS